MRRSTVVPANRPTAWVYLESDHTIRWQRGDSEAVVLRGNRVGSWALDGFLARIPVSAKGWADSFEVRLTGERWVRTQ